MLLFGIHPGIVFAIATAYSIAVFLGVWYLLNFSRNRILNRFAFIDKFLEKARRKGDSPFIRRFGLVGLAMVMAIPFPTIGVYGATSLSWMMGAKQWRALLAIASGVAVSNTLVLLSLLGIIHLSTFII